MQANTLHQWSLAQLFSFIQQAAHKAESFHEDLAKEHEQQQMQFLAVMEERDRLREANTGLQAQVNQLTYRFQSIWPTVTEANTKASMDKSTCTLIDYCDHIQMECMRLATTNVEMKQKLETLKSTLPDPVEIYTGSVENKVRELEMKKQALAEALTNGYTLMGKVHDWLGSLALKNH